MKKIISAFLACAVMALSLAGAVEAQALPRPRQALLPAQAAAPPGRQQPYPGGWTRKTWRPIK